MSLKLLLTKPVGTMACELADSAEKRPVDTIAVVTQVVNVLNGVCMFSLVLGATDSTGRFHIDMKRSDHAAIIHVHREPNPQAFDAIFLDENGFPRTNIPRELMESLLVDIMVPGAYKMTWMERYPDMEVSFNGAVVFNSKDFREKERMNRIGHAAPQIVDGKVVTAG